MQLGLGSYAFRWALGGGGIPARMRLADLVDETGRLGVDVLQIADSEELDSSDDAAVAALATRAEAASVRLQIGTTTAEPGRLRRYLDIARLAGSDIVRVVLHSSPDEVDADAAVAALGAVIGEYAEAGVRLAIENHFLTTSATMLDILQRVGNPALGVMLDVANSIVCGEWPSETIETLAPHAVGLHLKDYRFVPDDDGVGGHLVGTPLGHGWLDIPAVFRTLEDAGVVGADFAVILEQWSPRGADDAQTVEIETGWRERSVEAARAALTTEGTARRVS